MRGLEALPRLSFTFPKLSPIAMFCPGSIFRYEETRYDISVVAGKSNLPRGDSVSARKL